MNTYLFAYGSLMNPVSRAKTLPGDRPTSIATLQGYRRAMNVPFTGYAYLNIVPTPGSAVRGLLIPLSDEEFVLFSAREEGYTRTDITSALIEKPEGTVYAFIAPDIACDLKVPRSYILTCTAGMTDTERSVWLKETRMGEILEDVEAPVYEYAA